MIRAVFRGAKRLVVCTVGGLGLLVACGRVGIRLTPTDEDAGVPPPDAGPDIDGSVPELDGGDADAPDADAPDADAPDAAVCPTACWNAHGTFDCSIGRCELGCEVGYADCDGIPDNGCEADIAATEASCGECSTMCTNPNGSTMCTDGVCTPACAPLSADCDGNEQNGCETSLTTVDDCGGCGAQCTNVHGTTACSTVGTCESTCDAGYLSCDNDPDNGCETNGDTDPVNCGGCGTVCGAVQVCRDGSCAANPCSPDTAECDGVLPTCETSLGTTTNCEFCGDVCSAANGTAVCSTGRVCGLSGCGSGFADCDSTYANGCETALTSVTNCGTCGTTCTSSVPNATVACTGGTCTTQCMSGVYALRLAIASDWPDTTYTRGGSGTVTYWAQLVLMQSGASLSGTATMCNVTVPDFRNVINETYGITYPTGRFEIGRAPATAVSGTFTDTTTASIALNPAALLIGVNPAALGDPVNAPWPGLMGFPAADHDQDGRLGITTDFKTGAGYTLPPTTAIYFPPPVRASRGYIADRVVFSLGGPLNSCTQGTGTATVTRLEHHTLGCQVDSPPGGTCNATQTQHLDVNSPVYTARSATYRLVKLGDIGASFTCAQTRSAPFP
jgi:hypothetical protein